MQKTTKKRRNKEMKKKKKNVLKNNGVPCTQVQRNINKIVEGTRKSNYLNTLFSILISLRAVPAVLLTIIATAARAAVPAAKNTSAHLQAYILRDLPTSVYMFHNI